MDTLRDLLLSTTPGAILAVALLKATILLALVQAIVVNLPRLSAATRHLLLAIGISSFLVIPLVSFALPRWEVFVETPAPMQSGVSPAPEVVADDSATPALTAPVEGTTRRSLSTAQMPIVIWAAVSLFLIARLVGAMFRLRGIVRRSEAPSLHLLELTRRAGESVGLDSHIRLLVSKEVSVPMIWGLRSGTLLLPKIAEQWTDEQLLATVVHELGHLQRLDYLSLAVINFVSCVFWFHPQVWTARSRALTEGERACDDLVLRSGARASEYASHLLHVARLMPRHERLGAILAMSRPTQLEGRMYAILSPSVNRQGLGGKLLMISALSFVLLAAPLAAMQLSARPVTPAPIQLASTAGEHHAAGTMDHGGHHKGRNHSMNSRRNTGTCADYTHQFGDAEIAKSEQAITVPGRRLTLNAADNGGVSVRRATGNTFGVTVCKTAGGGTEAEARQILGQIDVRDRGGDLSVTGPDDRDWAVDFIVTVPDGSDLSLKGNNGPIAIRDVNATIDASVINGPMSLDNSRGEIKARTQNGPLALSGVSGNVDVATQNGPLTLSLDGNGWVGGELHARVGNGPLAVKVPAGYQTGISVSTNGHAPFSCKGDFCGAVDDVARFSREPRKLSLGTGPARIFVQGGNGPVSIKQQ